jgi:small subunit ribosomal protein S3e
VSGKLRAQRAKSMKFKDGYMISSGQPVKEYIDSAVRHVLLRQVSCLYCVSSRVPCHTNPVIVLFAHCLQPFGQWLIFL